MREDPPRAPYRPPAGDCDLWKARPVTASTPMSPGPRRTAAHVAVRAVRRRGRELTAPARALPDFIIAGAQRAGTTSLYDYLVQHQDVRAALRKEVHYFDLNHASGERWYRSWFPLRATLRAEARRCGRPQLTGEASPYYLFHPLAPERVHALIPAVRIIVLLRNPVERAFSHYRHEVAAGRELLGFEEAIEAEDERLAGEEERLRSDSAATSAAHRHHSYVARGMYAEQLERWFGVVAPEQVLVLSSESLFERPAEAYSEVLAFLSLRSPATPPSFDRRNQGRDAALPDSAREHLERRFAEPNLRLESLLGRALWS